jgi:hypothetical protein
LWQKQQHTAAMTNHFPPLENMPPPSLQLGHAPW